MVQRLIGPLSMSSCKVLQEAGILTAAAILEASEREGSHNSNLTDQRDKRKRNISVEQSLNSNKNTGKRDLKFGKLYQDQFLLFCPPQVKELVLYSTGTLKTLYTTCLIHSFIHAFGSTPKCFLSNSNSDGCIQRATQGSISCSRLEQPGIQRPTFQLVEALLYTPSYSHHKLHHLHNQHNFILGFYLQLNCLFPSLYIIIG